ncbi:kinase suppressor of Ras 2 [Cimex lectularius]|uniref:Kinase suppressor of ras n=1 Tax=Cimex lectularius TaxID=79782 RepID=A0A8I6RN35_CIMLE|nr:kinase suppressor of Ras 2 [Cimex lectularius]
MTEEEAEHRRTLDVLQSMIDTSADRLEGLRTKCATSAELTQHEIRTLEGKLIKLFSSQLTIKSKLKDTNADTRQLPSVQQWLQVVGLSHESIEAICVRVRSIDVLQEKSEHELKMLLNSDHSSFRQEELRRLNRALHNLKKYTEILVKGECEACELPLYWDSWDRSAASNVLSPRSQLRSVNRIAGSRLPADLDETPGILSGVIGGQMSPPSTPPVNKSKESTGSVGERGKFPSTPPPKMKHQTGLHSVVLLPDTHPLTKSKSHESQLANKVDGENNNTTTSTPKAGERRARLPTEPGPGRTSPQISSPIKSPPPDPQNETPCKTSSLQVPKSPRTPTITRGMAHAIAHRFTKTFKMMTTCDYCDKQMFIGTGLKCKECKYKCHRDCESKVPPSCGLPREFMDEFKKTLQTDTNTFMPNNSPSLGRPSPSHHGATVSNRREPWKTVISVPPFPGGPDSSSNTSSCNSSTPSSPALIQIQTPVATINKQQFDFPDVVTLDTHPLNRSQDSDRTVSGSTDSDRTPVRVDSQDSQVSDGEAADRPWPRQNSLSMREWDIPFGELTMGDPIGTGHFGTVYQGKWHGDVAIKVLKMTCLDDEKMLEGFRLDVATFRKTRHENLVLFMGACMKPPHLAIVTSMCKGYTLYTHIHIYKDKFTMNKNVSLAQQISQGMGYLHARGIIHKDLKTKNIFLENGKVVITDFGLFSVTKLCFGTRKGDGLSIPPGWLCYLAPEIVRNLRAHQKPEEDDLPFSQATDIYAFGTVWYELLCGEWPFRGQPPEAIIWQVGKGMKQTLANLQASRDVKEILMMCWSYKAADRPDFLCLHKTLEKLPKKRLARSPSHPIHLSRSAESVF